VIGYAVATLAGSDPSNPLSANPAVEKYLVGGFVAGVTLRARLSASSPGSCRLWRASNIIRPRFPLAERAAHFWRSDDLGAAPAVRRL